MFSGGRKRGTRKTKRGCRNEGKDRTRTVEARSRGAPIELLWLCTATQYREQTRREQSNRASHTTHSSANSLSLSLRTSAVLHTETGRGDAHPQRPRRSPLPRRRRGCCVRSAAAGHDATASLSRVVRARVSAGSVQSVAILRSLALPLDSVGRGAWCGCLSQAAHSHAASHHATSSPEAREAIRRLSHSRSRRLAPNFDAAIVCRGEHHV